MEVSSTIMLLDYIINRANELSASSSMLTSPLEYVCPDWSGVLSIHEQIKEARKVSKLSQLYVKYLEDYYSKQYNDNSLLRVCEPVYQFLLSPQDNANVLIIDNYNFEQHELSLLLSFFSRNKNSEVRSCIHELVITRTNATDDDIIKLSLSLPYLSNLKVLNLQRNNISSIGAIALATVLRNPNEFTGQFVNMLKRLYLDNNNIGPDGARILAHTIPRLPYLNTLSLSGNPITDTGM